MPLQSSTTSTSGNNNNNNDNNNNETNNSNNNNSTSNENNENTNNHNGTRAIAMTATNNVNRFTHTHSRTTTTHRCKQFWLDADTCQFALASLLSVNGYAGEVLSIVSESDDTATTTNNENAGSSKGATRNWLLVEEAVPTHINATLPGYISRGIRRYTELHCRLLCRHLAKRLQHLHEQNIAHMGLCVDSWVVVDDGTLQLCGLQHAQRQPKYQQQQHNNNSSTTETSQQEQHQPLSTRWQHNGRTRHQNDGWYAFQAPELECLDDKNNNNQHTTIDLLAADMWSLGVVFYVLLTGLPPFRGDVHELRHNKHAGFVEYDVVTPSAAAQDLLSHLICVNAHERYSVEQVLRHPWIRSAAGNDSSSFSSSPNNTLAPCTKEALARSDLSLAQSLLADWHRTAPSSSTVCATTPNSNNNNNNNNNVTRTYHNTRNHHNSNNSAGQSTVAEPNSFRRAARHGVFMQPSPATAAREIPPTLPLTRLVYATSGGDGRSISSLSQ